MFRIIESGSGTEYYSVKPNMFIEASDDCARTWYKYSRFDCELSHFRALAIHQESKTLVYLVGTASSNSQTCQVWVSKDSLKTIELVNENTGFDVPYHYDFTAGFDNVLILILGTEFDRIENTWISHDLGQSWESNSQNGIETFKGIRRISMLTVHRNRMYAQHVACELPALVCSTDRGLTWKSEPFDFSPCVLIADTRGDRVLCFMNSGICHIVGDSVQWEILPCNLQGCLGCDRFELYDDLWSHSSNPSLLSSGVIVLPVGGEAFCSFGSKYLISHPDHRKARKDKTRLAIYLDRLGINSALFVAHLAPFLFPS